MQTQIYIAQTDEEILACFDAHRLYLNKGFKIRSHHFALQLDE
ncbi:MAG: hypothetical protein AAF633_18165 [Chloroflexota bacterium]